MVRLEKIIYE